MSAAQHPGFQRVASVMLQHLKEGEYEDALRELLRLKQNETLAQNVQVRRFIQFTTKSVREQCGLSKKEMQETLDALQLELWREACPPDVAKYLDASLPGWREEN